MKTKSFFLLLAVLFTTQLAADPLTKLSKKLQNLQKNLQTLSKSLQSLNQDKDELNNQKQEQLAREALAEKLRREEETAEEQLQEDLRRAMEESKKEAERLEQERLKKEQEDIEKALKLSLGQEEEEEEEEVTTCLKCNLTLYPKRDNYIQLSCNNDHVFHASCLRSSLLCPICRSFIDSRKVQSVIQKLKTKDCCLCYLKIYPDAEQNPIILSCGHTAHLQCVQNSYRCITCDTLVTQKDKKKALDDKKKIFERKFTLVKKCLSCNTQFERKPGEKLYQTPCDHVFHRRCLNEKIKNNSFIIYIYKDYSTAKVPHIRCPYCNGNVKIEEIIWKMRPYLGGNKSHCALCSSKIDASQDHQELTCEHVIHKNCLKTRIGRPGYGCNICGNKISSGIIKKLQDDSLNAAKECSMCKEKYNQGDKVYQTSCLHIFHYNCIKNKYRDVLAEKMTQNQVNWDAYGITYWDPKKMFKCPTCDNNLSSKDLLQKIIPFPPETEEERVARIKKEAEKETIGCPVCLMDIEKDEKVSKLPCNHLLHTECAKNLLQNDPSMRCPTCRKHIPWDWKPAEHLVNS